MLVGHPAQWELTKSSGPEDETGQCVFADRLHERLDVRWRPVKHVPNLEKMLAQHRKSALKDAGNVVVDLEDAPEPWEGVVRKNDNSCVCHAGRCFKEQRLLVETTIVWPDSRDKELEHAILASIAPENEDSGDRRWEALGIRMSLGVDFDLHRTASRVGLVKWVFATETPSDGELTVERFAMPDTWLKTSLRDWLEQELAPEHRIVRQDPFTVNSHRGEQLTTHRRIGTVSALRRRRQVRLTRTWICPVEGRLYRVTFEKVSRDEEIEPPESLRVLCCGRAPATSQTSVGA